MPARPRLWGVRAEQLDLAVTEDPLHVIAGAAEYRRIAGLLGENRTVRCAGLAALARQRRRSAVILGARHHEDSQVELLRALARTQEGAPVLVLAERADDREVRALLAAGAAGVVAAAEIEKALVPSLQAVLAGQACSPRAHASQLAPALLSARQKQILGMVVMGCSNAEIARRLVVEESTVKSHLRSAFGKLGVRSRHEAANAILDPDRGLGVGILTLSAEPAEPVRA